MLASAKLQYAGKTARSLRKLAKLRGVKFKSCRGSTLSDVKSVTPHALHDGNKSVKRVTLLAGALRQ